MIKLSVTDMDGSLLDNLSQIPEENVKAIRRIQGKGIEFAIASGRDYASVKSVMDGYGIRCEMILGNGAQYVDKDGKILMNCYMDPQKFLEVISLMETERVNYMIFTTNGFYTGCDPQAAREAFVLRGMRRFGRRREDFGPKGRNASLPCNFLQKVEDFQEFITRDLGIIKAEAFALEPECAVQIREKLKRIDGIAYLSSFDDNIEVTDKNAQKGLILEKVAKLKGLSRDEIMVFGDGMNDITLFECFPGHSYAPANAEEAIRKIAHRVVPSNLENGFAEAVCLELGDE